MKILAVVALIAGFTCDNLLAASAHETGVKLASQKEYKDDDEKAPANETASVSQGKDDFTFSIIADFPCGTDLEAPYLISKNKKATLVIRYKPNALPDLSSCMRDLKINVAKSRLSGGATVYVLVGSEVIQHLQVR